MIIMILYWRLTSNHIKNVLYEEVVTNSNVISLFTLCQDLCLQKMCYQSINTLVVNLNDESELLCIS